MAEIEFTIPTVQYGNVKVRMTPQELWELSEGGISLYDVGQKSMEFLSLITQGFEDAKSIDFKPQQVTSQYQESPMEVKEKAVAEEAAHHDKVISEEAAEREIKSQLGATTVEPWTQDVPQTKKVWDDFDL